MKDFAGKVAAVTGAASGIGRALALDFARRGMDLVAADIEQGPLERVRGEIEALGRACLAVQTDVSWLESVRSLADAAFARFGAVHVLCNNAGVAVTGPIAEASHQDWQWVLGVNLWGVIHGLEVFLPRMIAQQQEGHIVNTASLAGVIASRDFGVYNTSKYAVVGLSETLVKELRAHGIGVSVICPMGVKTAITESERNRPAELRAAPRRESFPILLGGYITPEEVSQRVLAAIEADELYVFTHPEGLEFVERRFERIRKAYQAIL
jgi:NAD(P)-dependent dehydrogenase (short-subunit alcohol dehydrogenase family)